MATTGRLAADAQLTVRVSRAAPGDLAAGVRRRLERLGAVEAVEAIELRGIEPDLNDLAVDVEARLRLADGESEPAVADRLAEGFGVDVEDVRLPDPSDA